MLGLTRGMAAGAEPPATAPAIAQAISDLGDANALVRDRAAKLLWSSGKAAEPALKEAAHSDDPEVARRAKSILDDFAFGLFPDTPKEIFRLLDQFRQGTPPVRRAAVAALAHHGPFGWRVLLKLHRDETDPLVRRFIVQAIEPRAHEIAATLLGEGDEEGARHLLETVAEDGGRPAFDYAALLLLRGGLAERTAALKGPAATDPRAAALLAILARAAGDLPAARAAAEKSGAFPLVDSILIEQRDWKAMAARQAPRAAAAESVEELSFLAAYQRLAGDKAGLDQTVEKLQEHARRSPQDAQHCAYALMLSDQPERGIDVLLGQNDFDTAIDFLGPRFQFARALDLPKQAAEKLPRLALLKLQTKTAQSLHLTGKDDEARDLLAKVAAENDHLRDFDLALHLVEAARQIGQEKLADEFAVQALALARPRDSTAAVFYRLGLREQEGSSSSRWWTFLRQRYAMRTPAERLEQVRQIATGSMEGDKLSELTDQARQWAGRLGADERDAWLQAIGDAFAAAHRDDAAADTFAELGKVSSNPTCLIRAADYLSGQKRWDEASALYQKAWERDRSQPTPLYLQGWALEQAGKAEDGKAKKSLAVVLALGSEFARYELMDAMNRHGLKEEARRECELILRVTPPHTWQEGEALRETAQAAAEKGDYGRAADLLDRAFLQAYRTGITFREPFAYAIVPCITHKTRAIALIRDGDASGALQQMKLVLADCPGDVDAVIEVVGEFDKAGHKAEGDALFKEASQVFRKLCADYPHSSPMLNQLAWTQVKCNRDPDEALANATRAVELDPHSTAAIDTLAEIYFTRGDVPKAIETIKRCIELEPKEPHHRKQLERFEAAQKQRADGSEN